MTDKLATKKIIEESEYYDNTYYGRAFQECDTDSRYWQQR